MKHKFYFKKTFAAAAVISVITAVSVSGSMLIKQFSFESENKYYTVNSNQKEVNQEDFKNAVNIIENEQNNKPAEKIEPVNFNSIEDAEKSLDIKMVFPEIMPDLDLLDIEGNKIYFGENSSKSRIWVTYGDVNEKLFGITVEKTNLNDNDVFNIDSNDMDNGTLQNYTSSKGYKFDRFNESDETGQKTANIFTTFKNNYKYSVIFYKFSDDEMYNIVNSLDLESI